MKKLLLIVLAALMLSACTQEGDTMKQGYIQITPQEAKEIMDTQEGYIILDVREQYEYDAGHIPGAILIPYTQIAEKAEGILTDKSQLILVYCRSGRRSKIAAEKVAALGCAVVELDGGILSWNGEIER